MNPFAPLCRALCLAFWLTSLAGLPAARAADLTTNFTAGAPAGWTDALKARVDRIDRDTPGQLGVYIKRLDNGETFAYQADRLWYLASSAKLPVAIALLQEVEKNKLSLNQKLVLKETDKVDGSGAVVWQGAGTSYTVASLLKRMLMDSDNTAANMLIRAIGEDTLNDRAADFLGGKGFERITNFTAVRYDVYAELHPDARKMSNMDLVKVAASPLGPQRLNAVVRTMGVDKNTLRAKTLDEAYGRYYQRNLNSATLEAYGGMLEKMVRGKLVSPAHLKLLFTDLKYDTYDAYRLEAGLPRTVKFIHKTGTQMGRACHMGVINPQDDGRNAIVVATCAQDLDEHQQAGRAFEQIGRAITETMLSPKAN